MDKIEEKIKDLEKKISKKLEEKHWKQFERQASFLGNGIYGWRGVYSTDTRELFLMGIALVEGIKYEKS